MNIPTYRRIAIVGNNGSGKSFLDRELAAVTGLPLTHLDLEYWRPNWEHLPEKEWLTRQLELAGGKTWILDGTHSGTLELRFREADLVLFIDRNRIACLAGVLKRYGKARPDMPPCLKDRVNRQFFSLLKGLWNFPKTRRKTILYLHKKYPEIAFPVITSKRDMMELLNCAKRLATSQQQTP